MGGEALPATRTQPEIALINILAICALLMVALVGGIFLYRRSTVRPLRPDEPGFPYVWVNNRGRARELCAEEREYLNQKFDSFDGARPAIMFRYEKFDSSEFRSGFIERKFLPREVEIIKLTPEDELRTRNDTVSINQAVFEGRRPTSR